MSRYDAPLNCGCPGGDDVDWDEIIRRINDEEDEEEELIPVVIPVEPERIPVRKDDVFSPVRKTEEVEADR